MPSRRFHLWPRQAANGLPWQPARDLGCHVLSPQTVVNKAFFRLPTVSRRHPRSRTSRSAPSGQEGRRGAEDSFARRHERPSAPNANRLPKTVPAFLRGKRRPAGKHSDASKDTPLKTALRLSGVKNETGGQKDAVSPGSGGEKGASD